MAATSKPPWERFSFNPGLATGSSTYFALEDSAADINSHGGLIVTGETFAGQTATPEPADFAPVGLGASLLLFLKRRKSQQAWSHNERLYRGGSGLVP